MDAEGRTDDSARVLVVDDEPETAEIIAKMLRPDYDVRIAYGGEEALETVDSTIDVVFLDRRMPETSGDEVLEAIRSRGIDCRVVMVTAAEPDTDIIKLDFDDYLVKPVSAETMRDAVERMLTRDQLDGRFMEAMSLASKMATLESKMGILDLESSEEYAELEARFAEYRALFDEIEPSDDLYGELSTTKMKALFGDN